MELVLALVLCSGALVSSTKPHAASAALELRHRSPACLSVHSIPLVFSVLRCPGCPQLPADECTRRKLLNAPSTHRTQLVPLPRRQHASKASKRRQLNYTD